MRLADQTPTTFADLVAAMLATARLDLSTEKATQAEIAAVLDRHGLPYRRELRLSSRDIVDFFVGDNTALEVKIGGAKAATFRQLSRYANHDRVQAIVLATNVPMSLPTHINLKPCRVAALGAAWL